MRESFLLHLISPTPLWEVGRDAVAVEIVGTKRAAAADDDEEKEEAVR